MHRISRLPFMLAMLLLPGLAVAGETSSRAVALELLDRLDQGRYAEAVEPFTPTMVDAVPATQLHAIWTSLPAQFGAPLHRGAVTTTPAQGVELVAVPLYYERGALTANVAITPDGQIAGFRLVPLVPPPESVPAAAGFIERPIQVVSQRLPLAGTLTVPKGEGPFPAVVLVHGSGPHGRNETIGPNHIFLQLARGLGEQGITVLRYDKRTHTYPEQFADGDFTMEDETIADAVAAVEVLREQPEVRAGDVFVLGHSQGGMLAPRIAERTQGLAGLVLFAAPARSLLDLLPEQNRYLFGLDRRITDEERDFLETLEQQIAALRSERPIDRKNTPMQLPAAYWHHADRIDPVADAQGIDVPMLLVQGGRDFQVTQTDWERWKQGLADQTGVEFRYYPTLNHLGIAGQGASSLAEYQEPGDVDMQLITDIAGWINQVPDA
ncbi:alpha/beta fold hydrolase [Abyssibacter sp.]|uniref:alpha/beta hydrolase n=1 Tax=Abyssibacter sp. TaxID=2320200 RepID=UPI003512F2CD